MKLFNNLFYIFLFIGFFLPTNSNFYLPVPGVLLKINELAFLLLPIINLRCYCKGRTFPVGKKLKILILLFFASVILMEVFKMIAYNESFAGALKSLRIGLPLFSSLALAYQGIRADIKIVWKTLLWAIFISTVLSIISIFVYLPIYYNSDSNTNAMIDYDGRLSNSNASFSIIGLFLLLKNKSIWYNKGKLPFYTSIASIISIILTFNRTYLALLVVLFIYLAFSTFTWKKALKLITMPILMLVVFTLAYQYSQPIHEQVDQRIFSLLRGSTSLQQSVIENNRDIIYEGIQNRIKEGYWLFGLPNNKPIFEMNDPLMGMIKHNLTDLSLVNILLTNGLISLAIFLTIYRKFIKMKFGPPIVMFVFFIASFNLDELYSHNTIFFMIMFGFVFKFRHRLRINPNPSLFKSFNIVSNETKQMI
jgi:hypothetical protein